MNTFSRFKSIKLKLMSVILAVTFISLFLGFTSFFLVLSYNLKNSLKVTMETKARLLAEFCVGPMEFGRKEYVRDEVLSKLSNVPEVTCARVTNRNNELFAFYRNDCPPPMGIEITGQNASIFQDEYLHVLQKIEFKGESYGTIYLMVSTENMNAELSQFFLWLLGIVAAITLISILSANRLQRIISGPVKRLAGVTGKISQDGDYSLRVEKESDDEVGELYDSFNLMLSQIAYRQEEERKSKRALEVSESKYRNIF